MGCREACSTSGFLTAFLIVSSLVVTFLVSSVALVVLHTLLRCHHHSSSSSSSLVGIFIDLLLLGGGLGLDWNVLLDLVLLLDNLLGSWYSGSLRRRWARTFYGRRAGGGVGGGGGVRGGSVVRFLAWPAAGGEGGGLGRQGGAVGGVSSTRGALGQTFHSELLSNSKEGVEVILSDVDLTMVHEVEHALHVPVGNSLQVEHQGTLLAGRLVSPQDGTEERTACREDHLVSLKLLVLAGDGYVKKTPSHP